MLTATQISEQTGIAINQVRYRLSVLRQGGTKANRVGNAWVYSRAVIKRVIEFDK